MEPLEHVPQLPAKLGERTAYLQGIDTRGGGSNLPESWDPAGLAGAYQISALLARSALVPKSLQGRPEDIMIILWTGKELGLSAMTALRHLPVVHGRAGMSAELMRARAIAHPECDRFDVVEADAEHCKIAVQRSGFDLAYVTFSIEDARRAGLVREGSGWKSWPEDMCVARATSRAVRRYFPDVLGPVSYTPEELHDIAMREGSREPAPAPAAREEARKVAATVVEAIRPAKVVEPPPPPPVVADPGPPDADPGDCDPLPPADDPRVLEAKRITEAAVPPAPPAEPERSYQSILDMEIPGVGEKVAASLWNAGIRTPEDMVAAGTAGLAELKTIGKLTAQGIILWAEKQKATAPPAPPAEEPEPEWEPAPKAPAASDEPLFDENGVLVEEDPRLAMIPVEPPEPKKAKVTLPPGISEPKVIYRPIRPYEVSACERILIAKMGKEDGIAWMKQFVLDAWGVGLDTLDGGFFAALYEACESAPNPNGPRLAWLRSKGIIKA